MGFFSELKEDLSQAVNELLPDEDKQDGTAIPNDAKSLELLLEKMDEDDLLADALEKEAPIGNREEPAVEAGSYFASVIDQKEDLAPGGLLEEPIQEEQLEEEILGNPAVEKPVPEKPIAEEAVLEEAAVSEESETEETVSGETAAQPLQEAALEETEREYKAAYSEENAGITTESEKVTNSEMLDHKAENEKAVEALQENEEETGNMKMDAEKFEGEKAAEAVESTEAAEENSKDNGGFNKMDSQLANREVVDETAVITAGMTINGDIISEGSMEVLGSIVGNIDILGKLNITGSVQGNSKAAEIYCESAKITGEIASEGSVKIGQSTVIIGNILANSAVIAGAVKGDIDVHGPVVLDTTAIVMGNIKSKSVQINNGAVIEGMCSQCYADVSPSSFFEDFKALGIGKGKGNK